MYTDKSFILLIIVSVMNKVIFIVMNVIIAFQMYKLSIHYYPFLLILAVVRTEYWLPTIKKYVTVATTFHEK